MALIDMRCRDCGKLQERFYRGRATEAAREMNCDGCGAQKLDVEWTTARPRSVVDFREGLYDIRGEKVYCNSRRELVSKAADKGVNIHWRP